LLTLELRLDMARIKLSHGIPLLGLRLLGQEQQIYRGVEWCRRRAMPVTLMSRSKVIWSNSSVGAHKCGLARTKASGVSALPW